MPAIYDWLNTSIILSSEVALFIVRASGFSYLNATIVSWTTGREVRRRGSRWSVRFHHKKRGI